MSIGSESSGKVPWRSPSACLVSSPPTVRQSDSLTVCQVSRLCFLIGSRGIWELDLHGLHGGEAVHMLEERLALVERELRTNPGAQPQSHPAANEKTLGAARNVVLRPELVVITGACKTCLRYVQ